MDFKNAPKIVSKSSLGGPWGVSGGAQGPPRGLPGAVGLVYETRRKFTKNLKRPGHVPESILEPSRDPKIYQKLNCCAKGCSRERVFIDFCGKCRFPWLFGWFLVDFSWKIDEKTDVFFHNCACFFQTGDPHETPYFTIRKLLFHFLRFAFFS